MSFNNTSNLRRSLDAKQDWAVGQERSSYRDLHWIGEPRPSAFKSTEDRKALAVTALSSDLSAFREPHVAVGISAYSLTVVASLPPAWRVGTKSSEAGERERQAQAQHSRTFHAEEKERYYQNTGSLDGFFEDDEVAQVYGLDAPSVCEDCGEVGERTGHQTCQYPQDH